MYAQKLPDTIRGYKVHQAKTRIVHGNPVENSEARSDVVVTMVGDPRIAEIQLTGAVFEQDAEFTAAQNGKVDLITYHDFYVNGIPVKIGDVTKPFSFKKNQTTRLTTPIRISVSVMSVPRALYKQGLEIPDHLLVTGKVFVYGRFKRYGFSFKRVIPIAVELKIKNPLHTN